MPAIPTIKIKADTEKGSRIINASDFDAKTMTKFGAAKPAPKKKPTPKKPAKK